VMSPELELLRERMEICLQQSQRICRSTMQLLTELDRSRQFTRVTLSTMEDVANDARARIDDSRAIDHPVHQSPLPEGPGASRGQS
jgi:hypothetical protein